ncbi:MAG: DNA adenine methylase [Planctomycetales bacterium]
MGSKAKLLIHVVDVLNQVHDGGGVCDLFAGSAVLSGAIGRSVQVFSNDVQHYSRPLAETHLTAWKDEDSWSSPEELKQEITDVAREHLERLPTTLNYADCRSLQEFQGVEERNRGLIECDFDHPCHLYLKYYSGTWWSARQCAWIDAIRQVIERYSGTPHQCVIMASLMHAMCYCGSGTGHFAQFRDAKTKAAMDDVRMYRKRGVLDYFLKKYELLCEDLPLRPTPLQHEITALDYRDRLAALDDVRM